MKQDSYCYTKDKQTPDQMFTKQDVKLRSVIALLTKEQKSISIFFKVHKNLSLQTYLKLKAFSFAPVTSFLLKH